MNTLDVLHAMLIKLDGELPLKKEFQNGIRRAPDRGLSLSRKEIALALKNALRYIPNEWHPILAPEFLKELKNKSPDISLIVGIQVKSELEMKLTPETFNNFEDGYLIIKC